jgi:hypothetical protein
MGRFSEEDEEGGEALSAPDLSDEVDDAFEPLPPSAQHWENIACLCKLTAAWSVHDEGGLETRLITGIHANLLSRYKDDEQDNEPMGGEHVEPHDEPMDDSPTDSSLERKLPDQSGFFPAAKRTCLAAKSGSREIDSGGANHDSMTAPVLPSSNHNDQTMQNARAFRDKLRSLATSGTVSASPIPPTDDPAPARKGPITEYQSSTDHPVSRLFNLELAVRSVGMASTTFMQSKNRDFSAWAIPRVALYPPFQRRNLVKLQHPRPLLVISLRVQSGGFLRCLKHQYLSQRAFQHPAQILPAHQDLLRQHRESKAVAHDEQLVCQPKGKLCILCQSRMLKQLLPRFLVSRLAVPTQRFQKRKPSVNRCCKLPIEIEALPHTKSSRV